jgi:drug/metabolite transporter (DMT)-like permease
VSAPSVRRLGGAPLAAFAAVAWGANFPLLKTSLGHMGAVPITAFRYVIATAVFVAVLAAVEGTRSLRFDGRFVRVLVLGSAGFAGFNILANIGLQHTRPQNVALIAGTMPVLALLGTWMRSRVRPAGSALAFAFLAFAGVALVISKGHLGAIVSGNLGSGELFALVAAICWVTYTLGASDFPEWSPLRYATLTTAAGAITNVAITAIVAAAGVEPLPGLGDIGAVWPQLLGIVVPGTLLAVLAWNDAVHRLGPPNAALFMNLVPVTTFGISVAQGYRFQAVEIAGALITVGALVGANLAARRPGRAVSREPVQSPVAGARPLATSGASGSPR